MMPIIEFINTNTGLLTYTLTVLFLLIAGAWHQERR